MRPDQQKFELIASSLCQFDELLAKYQEVHEWTLLKNNHRHPSRALRKEGNPEYSIELQLCGDWHQLADGAPPTFELSANGWYSDAKGVWHLGKIYFTSLDCRQCAPRLEAAIEGAIFEMGMWNAPVIQTQGRFQAYHQSSD